MKIKQKDGHLVAEIEIDNTLLQEKLKLLIDLQSCFFKGINDDSLSITLHSLVNDSNIFLINFTAAKGADESDKSICTLDLDITGVLREWIITMRASDND